MSGPRARIPARRAELSQHFLSESRAPRIVRLLPIEPADHIIEIGAGRGALTRPLLARTSRVDAVEVDPWLAESLRGRFGEKLTVIEADFLSQALPVMPWRAVGNITYGRSAEIIRYLTAAEHPPDDAWLVVQKEYAYRLCGRPFVRESLNSLALKLFWHLQVIDRLARSDFSPPPAVDSVLLWLQKRQRPLLILKEKASYKSILKASFIERSDSVVGALRPWLSKI